jgi:lipopolysaccharide export system protein LptA
LYKLLLIVFFCLFSIISFAQQKRIKIVHADNSTIDEKQYPGATILLGNVYIEHEGFFLRSKKAIYYKSDNFLKAYGDVFLNQGDTITQTSKYVEYNGDNKKALSWGNVILKDPIMTLTTDSLRFDRLQQKLYYRSGATIKDTTNVLESKIGNYFLETNKFEALSDVVLTNPDYVLESNNLVYYTNTGKTYLDGPSTITGEDNFIYTEKGYYDTKADISHFTKNSRIEYQNREIKADSLYYDRTLGFASATQNIQLKDTVNSTLIKGNYGEFYQKLDSAFVINRAVAISEIDKDSMYVHGDTLLVTGKPDYRIIRAYRNVKFFKSNLSGKCDSIHSNQATGLTQMFRNPILWSEENQITGDTINLISNTVTEKIDSLKVLNNTFIIQKDSIGFNQIKGRNLFGKFIDNDLQDVLIIGNGENIFYIRNEETNELIGVDKTKCSSMRFQFKNSELQKANFITMPEGDIFPLSEFPENVRKLRGFIWREKEKPLTKDDIFIKDDEIITKEEISKKNDQKIPDNIKKVVVSRKINTAEQKKSSLPDKKLIKKEN